MKTYNYALRDAAHVHEMSTLQYDPWVAWVSRWCYYVLQNMQEVRITLATLVATWDPEYSQVAAQLSPSSIDL